MDLNNLINMANEAAKNKKIHEAINLFKKAFEIDPASFDLCSKLGILTFQLGDLDNSIKYFKRTLLLDPKSSLGYSNLGIIYSKLNKQEFALQNYLKAIEIDPNNFTANYNLANHYFFNNDDKNAEKYYLYSIKLNPEHFYPYNNLFQLYDRSNNLVKLEETFSTILKLFGRTNLVQFLEGILEFKKKDYKKTIELFKNLDVDKNDIQKSVLKTNILAKCYDYIGSYSKAYNYYSISNNLLENSFNKKFDKKKFNDRIVKRLNFISKIKDKLINSEEIIDNNADPIFLIGFPRSGTTLLDTVLRTHNSIEVIEEKLLVEDLIDKLSNYINGDLLNLNSINVDAIIDIRNSYFKKREALVGYNKNLIYIDKLPLNIIYVAELNKIFPKARFILVLRNPFDAVLSCFMQPFLPNEAMSNFYNLKDASEFYDLVMKLWIKYQQNLNLNLHTIKYEDVVDNFDISIKKLLNFLNVAWSNNLKSFHLTAKKRGIINTPSYNQVNEPLYKESVSRWKNYSDKISDVSFKLEKWIKRFEY